MKIVVTDACIFIDVISLNLTAKFFGLELDIHTTAEVINELFIPQQQILEGYKTSNKLTVHILSGDEQMALMSETYPKGLTPEDRSVVFIAQKLENAILLSSDKPVRNHAKKLSIEYHGMLWIFDKLVEEKVISNDEAISKIKAMSSSNIIYKNNRELQIEIDKRIKNWSNK